jgi:hypothetical protein
MSVASLRERIIAEMRVCHQGHYAYPAVAAWDVDGELSDSDTLAEIMARGIFPEITDTDPNDWRESVLGLWDPSSSLPPAPAVGDRYISTGTGNGWQINNIYEWDGAEWIAFVPDEGCTAWDEYEDVHRTFFEDTWRETPPGAHVHDANDIVAGTIAVARGGTNIGSYTTGNYLRAQSSSALEQRTPAQVRGDIGAAAASHTHGWNDITATPTTLQGYGITGGDFTADVTFANAKKLRWKESGGASVDALWVAADNVMHLGQSLIIKTGGHLEIGPSLTLGAFYNTTSYNAVLSRDNTTGNVTLGAATHMTQIAGTAVGVGTDSPESELHTHRGSGTTCYNRVSVGAYSTAWGIDTHVAAEVRYSNYIGNSRTTFWLYTGPNVYNRFSIWHDGKIGAGMATPDWDLHLGPYLIDPDYNASLQNKSTVIGVSSSNGTSVYTAKFDMTNAGLLQIGNTAGNANTVLYANNGYTRALAIRGDRNAASFFSGESTTKWDWSTSYQAVEFGNHAAVMTNATTPYAAYMAGLFYDGAYKHSVDGYGAIFGISSGAFYWHNTTSGTTPNAATLIERMRLDVNGHLGIGVAPPTSNSGYNHVYVATFDIMGHKTVGAAYLCNNCYHDGGNWRSRLTDQAAILLFENDGSLKYYATADAVTAGNVLTNFAERFKIGADAKVTITRVNTSDSFLRCDDSVAGQNRFDVSGSGAVTIGNSTTAGGLTLWGNMISSGYASVGGYLKVLSMKSGTSQAGAGAAAGELWYHSSTYVVYMGV